MFRMDVTSDLLQSVGARRMDSAVSRIMGSELYHYVKERAPVGDYHNDPYVYHGYASGPRLKDSLNVSGAGGRVVITGITYGRYVTMDVKVLRTARARRWWAGFLRRYPDFKRKTEGPPRTYLKDYFIEDALIDYIRNHGPADVMSRVLNVRYGGTRIPDRLSARFRAREGGATAPEIPEVRRLDPNELMRRVRRRMGWDEE